MPRLARTPAILLLLCGLPSATESLAEAPPARVGWGGHVVLGGWSPLTVDVELPQSGEYRLDVTATDGDGNLATYQGDDMVGEAGQTLRLMGRFQLGKPDGVVTGRILRDGSLWTEVAVPRTGDPDTPLIPHTQAERLLITAGLPERVQQMLGASSPGRPTIIHLPDCSELPSDRLSYDGVAGLLIAGRHLPSEVQAAALDRWIRLGGRLYVSVGLKPAEFRESSLAKFIPVTIQPEPQTLRELISLESYAGKNVRILPAGTPISLPKFSFAHGRSLAGHRDNSVLIQVPHGFGTVTLLGMDATELPLTAWEGLPELLRRMTATGEFAAERVGRSQQLGSTGISEFSSQISAALEHFEPVSRTSPWWILGGLFVVMAIVGPLDYWLVARVFRRPLATWITFPILLALSASAAIWAAGTTNGTNWLLNGLDIVDVDAASGFARGRHFLMVYSPESTAANLEFQPTWSSWNSAAAPPRQLLGWWGLPESTFGGMYRSDSGGLQWGRARYSLNPPAGAIDALPLAQWSTAAVSAKVETVLGDLVESNLVSSATGRLTGTVLHRLPGPLTDWFLVYSGRIYRLRAPTDPQAVLPLSPNQIFRVDQGAVQQRELRGYLTQTTAHSVRRANDKHGAQLVLQQASYDSTSRRLTDILPILSFHAEVGGSGYTGLTNDMLADQDLTPLLELDRAVLFGYLEQPASEATLSAGIAPAVRRTTLIRLLLPVERSKQALPDLPKFDKP